MAVFVCAADESADQNPRNNFVYGGWAAPLADWEGPFAEAWNERVLNRTPQIPYLHMTSIMSPKWRAEHGLTPVEVGLRLDEASRVIRSMGSLIPVMLRVNENDYNTILRQPFLPPGRKRPVTLDPDYICFIAYVLTQLMWIHQDCPDAERVDFWVEQNGEITRHLTGFHAKAADGLRGTGSPHLAPLLGEFNQVGKDRIPVQVADMLAWHDRNYERGTLDRDGTRRLMRMTHWGKRYGYRGEIASELLRKLAADFAGRLAGASADVSSGAAGV